MHLHEIECKHRVGTIQSRSGGDGSKERESSEELGNYHVPFVWACTNQIAQFDYEYHCFRVWLSFACDQQVRGVVVRVSGQ